MKTDIKQGANTYTIDFPATEYQNNSWTTCAIDSRLIDTRNKFTSIFTKWINKYYNSTSALTSNKNLFISNENSGRVPQWFMYGMSKDDSDSWSMQEMTGVSTNSRTIVSSTICNTKDIGLNVWCYNNTKINERLKDLSSDEFEFSVAAWKGDYINVAMYFFGNDDDIPLHVIVPGASRTLADAVKHTTANDLKDMHLVYNKTAGTWLTKIPYQNIHLPDTSDFINCNYYVGAPFDDSTTSYKALQFSIPYDKPTVEGLVEWDNNFDYILMYNWYGKQWPHSEILCSNQGREWTCKSEDTDGHKQYLDASKLDISHDYIVKYGLYTRIAGGQKYWYNSIWNHNNLVNTVDTNTYAVWCVDVWPSGEDTKDPTIQFTDNGWQYQKLYYCKNATSAGSTLTIDYIKKPAFYVDNTKTFNTTLTKTPDWTYVFKDNEDFINIQDLRTEPGWGWMTLTGMFTDNTIPFESFKPFYHNGANFKLSIGSSKLNINSHGATYCNYEYTKYNVSSTSITKTTSSGTVRKDAGISNVSLIGNWEVKIRDTQSNQWQASITPAELDKYNSIYYYYDGSWTKAKLKPITVAILAPIEPELVQMSAYDKWYKYTWVYRITNPNDVSITVQVNGELQSDFTPDGYNTLKTFNQKNLYIPPNSTRYTFIFDYETGDSVKESFKIDCDFDYATENHFMSTIGWENVLYDKYYEETTTTTG